MKTTENYEQLLARFTKRLAQTDPEDKERVSFIGLAVICVGS